MRQLYSFYSDAFWIAIKSILEHKLRAFLTLIGIIIGVAAVIVVAASISGLKTYVVETASKVLGSNHFMMNRMASMGKMSDEDYERRNRRNEPHGKLQDIPCIVGEMFGGKLCAQQVAQRRAPGQTQQQKKRDRNRFHDLFPSHTRMVPSRVGSRAMRPGR